MTAQRAPLERWYRQKEICEALGISRMTFYCWRRDGAFPEGQRIGPNTIAWSESVVREHLASRPKATFVHKIDTRKEKA